MDGIDTRHGLGFMKDPGFDGGRDSLPHGAKGFDLGEAVFLFADGKVVITAKGSPTHLTVHFGAHSGVLDIHKRSTAADGSSQYVTLFTIPRDNLLALLQEFGIPLLQAQMRALRRLRPGWMAKRRVGVVVGISISESQMSSEISAITKLRRGRLVVDSERLAEHVRAPEFLEELYDLPDGQTFTLFACRKQRRHQRNHPVLGLGFKFTDPLGRPRLVWLPKRRVGQVFKEVGGLLESAARKYGTFHEPLPWL